jgi:hypothetical protein
MKDSIKISKIILDGVPSDFSVGDWKKLRIKLYQSEANWPVAFEVFENRINSRFLDPIEIIKKNGTIALFASQPFTTKIISSNEKDFRYCWYWLKNQGTNFFHAKRMPIRKIEEICIFKKGKY